MLLKKLELHGFKSFADRTEVSFSDGITSVVGPNGCGKSNIIDAVRWVLGEQRARTLRSEKMQNIIFNGTSKRRALGLAEVSLLIENTKNVLPTEYTDVKITRRLYRSGESEYLLNDVVCRLKDIVDLFMDTGMGAHAYSVIELKMIEEILSDNTNDRRRLFEEAAGITKYRIRRAQTLRKLESTRGDLTRIKDITDELEKQVERLARQAKKAKKVLEVRNRLGHLERSLALHRYQTLALQLEEQTSRLKEAGAEAEKANSAVLLCESELEAAHKSLIDTEQVLSERQRETNQLLDLLRKIEADRNVLIERKQTTLQQQERLKKEAAEEGTKRAELDHRTDTLSSQMELVAQELKTVEGERDHRHSILSVARKNVDAKRSEAESLVRAERQASDKLIEYEAKLSRLSGRREWLAQELAKVEARIKTVDTSATDEILAELETEIENQTTDLSTAQQELDNAELEAANRALALDSARTELHAAERKHDAHATELRLVEALVSSYEDFSEATRFLAEAPDWSAESPNTVSDLIGCDPEYQRALETALGSRSGFFVVKTLREAQAAVLRLRVANKGQAAFFILDRLNVDTVSSPKIPGTEELRNLVRIADPRASTLADLLLRHVYVVPSLDEAASLSARYADSTIPLRFVATTGEWASSHGPLSGGSPRAARPSVNRFARREQLVGMREVMADIEKDLVAKRKQFENARIQSESIDLAPYRILVAERQRALAETERQHARRRYEKALVMQQANENKSRHSTVLEEQQKADLALAEMAPDQHRLSEAHKRAEIARRDGELVFARLELTRNEASEQFNQANIRAIQTANRLENIRTSVTQVGKERRELELRSETRAEQQDQLAEILVAAETSLASLQAELALLQEKHDSVVRRLRDTENEVNVKRAFISEKESEARFLRRTRDELQQANNELRIGIAETQIRLDELVQRTREELEIDLTTEERDPTEPPFDLNETVRTAEKLRQKARSMGSINELALETWEEEKNRLDFLMTQRADLEQAEGTLMDTISKINITASKRFAETFAQINVHFGRIFAGLFAEGDTALLELVGDDPLDAEIEIIAKPRGKKPSTIAQLSGGEKTLTAIALLFSIYLVKPSPFCILDEVDAPLDDSNVERFMDLIRRFADSTQFILVTHNKLTMEAADRMYGITMQEQGVSKLVGVSFEKPATAA